MSAAEPAPEHGERALADLLGPFRPRGRAETAVTGTLDIPAFTDDAERRGLAFNFDNGHSDLYQLPETFGGGVAVLDFDGDGWLDVYAVGGGPFPPPQGPACFGDRLFRNRGDGQFDDVTSRSGLGELKGGYGFGVAVGDFDNDGHPDIFVTRWRCYALYHNLGDGRFEDVTASTGLGGDRDWPTSAAWADLDNDGDLDLYVCHYLKWDAVDPLLCATRVAARTGIATRACCPRSRITSFETTPAGSSTLPRRRESSTATDAAWGLSRPTSMTTAGSTCSWPTTRRPTFSSATRAASDSLRRDWSRAWRPAPAAATWQGWAWPVETSMATAGATWPSPIIWANRPRSITTTAVAGSATARPRPRSPRRPGSCSASGWPALDANNDGHLDLAQANGHVDDYRPAVPYLMPAQLFLGDGAGKLVDVSDRAGMPWRRPRLGRGLAVGDLDNDGRTDVVIVAQNAPLALLHNQSASPNHFVTLALEGTASNHDAVGARVAVTVSR